RVSHRCNGRDAARRRPLRRLGDDSSRRRRLCAVQRCAEGGGGRQPQPPSGRMDVDARRSPRVARCRRYPRDGGRLPGTCVRDRGCDAPLPARRLSVVQLGTEAEARLTNSGRLAAVLVNGGTSRPVAGTWSATSELLVRELAPRFPGIGFLEVRYRIKSWKALERCFDDGNAALDLAVANGA